MKYSQIILSIFALAYASFGVAQAEGYHAAYFPPKGTPYDVARAALLKRGLIITHDPREHPQQGIFIPRKLPPLDKKFPEIDCKKQYRNPVYCEALFLEIHPRGWRVYVVVDINPKDKTVSEIHYPYDVEGLPAIPGPVAADVPNLKGSYVKAREVLRTLGFRPTRDHSSIEVSRVCSDKRCKHQIPVPEAQCLPTGMAPCFAYWISPHNRVLRVDTMGEDSHIYFVEWSTWKDLRADFGK